MFRSGALPNALGKMAGWASPRRQQETVSDRLASGWEGALVGFAQKLVNQIEGTPTTPQPAAPGPSLEEVLLEGSVPERRRPEEAAGLEAAAPATELDLLRADFDALLLQRAKLRAQLVAEQERRARAEAELVSLGACWLGTDTQEDLQRRAAAERQRGLDAARADLMREAEQRVAKVRAEMALLQQRLGEKAPSPLALRMELRGALNAELTRERQEARVDVGVARRLALCREDALELRVDAPARDVDADRRGRRRERAVGRAGSPGLHRRPRVAHLAGEPRARAVDEVVEAKLLVALVERAGAEERLELWHVTAGAREDGGVGQCALRAVDEERQRAGERADERGRCEFDARAQAEPVEPRRELGRVAHEHVARHAGRVAVGDAHDRGVEARRGCCRRRWR